MRLTERMEDGSYDVKQCRDCISFNCIFCSHLTKAIQKLGKLEDIHNGLLQKMYKYNSIFAPRFC